MSSRNDIPSSTRELQALAQRISAYKEMHIVGNHVYAGDRLVASFNEYGLGALTMADLQALLCVAPELLRNLV